jgi:hypothetical protein
LQFTTSQTTGSHFSRGIGESSKTVHQPQPLTTIEAFLPSLEGCTTVSTAACVASLTSCRSLLSKSYWWTEIFPVFNISAPSTMGICHTVAAASTCWFFAIRISVASTCCQALKIAVLGRMEASRARSSQIAPVLPPPSQVELRPQLQASDLPPHVQTESQHRCTSAF